MSKDWRQIRSELPADVRLRLDLKREERKNKRENEEDNVNYVFMAIEYLIAIVFDILTRI